MPNVHVHDPELLDAIEGMEQQPFVGHVWRVFWATRDPLAGGISGGRWHPPNEFEALYTSLEEYGAMAEMYYHLSKAPVFSSSHMKISRLRVSTERTLAFSEIKSLAALGVTEKTFRSGAYERTREIGFAARFLEIDGLKVPSARWPGSNLVLFLDRVRDRDSLEVVETRDINWPAWSESAEARKAAEGSLRGVLRTLE